MEIKKIEIPAVMLAAALLLGAGPRIFRKKGGEKGSQGSYCGLFDVRTVGTESGTVESAEHVVSLRGNSGGLRVMIRTAAEILPVHLGPELFLAEHGFSVAQGDRLEVRGSRIVLGRRPVILAMSVRKNGAVLDLRDEKGFPLWPSRRRNWNSGR